jgi:hypothetical protein
MARRRLAAAVRDDLVQLVAQGNQWVVEIREDDGSGEPTIITAPHASPGAAVIEAIDFYNEAVGLQQLKGIARPTHEDVLKAREILSEEDGPTDYPTCELTRAQFEAVPFETTIFDESKHQPGDVVRIRDTTKKDNDPGVWLRLTFTSRQTATGNWFRKVERIEVKG